MDDEEESGGGDGGGAGWIATFADLMSLLMCFFVLLLSFSEMDVLKFKRLAGSMRSAFGVQRELRVHHVPKGTSIIAQEFSPGRPDPTPLNQIWQKTSDITEHSLEVACQDMGSSNAGEKGDAQKLVVTDMIADLIGETEQDAVEMATMLSQQIAEGLLEIETVGRQIVIRIKENGVFKSGSDEMADEFIPVLDIIRDVLTDTSGDVQVQGHTDSLPMRGGRFRSNWDLSAARAVSVAMGLFAEGLLSQDRFSVMGFGSTRPLESNDNPAGRARNRRVEIVVHQGLNEDVKREMKLLQNSDPASYSQLRDELYYKFELQPDEIF